MFPSRASVAVSVASASVLLAGCGSGSASADGESLSVVTSFYPLEFVAEQVGGQHVDVTNLTKPGAEPHDLELTPQDVGRVGKADLVVYLHGFQPAVDDAVESEAADSSFDVEGDARLEAHGAAEDDHGDGGHGGGQDGGHEAHGGLDPHFWLDPTRLADVGDALAERMAEMDAANAGDYRARATELRHELEALDGEFSAGLAQCRSRDLVTSHEAFGYLAEKYDLHQVGITGLTPDSDPDPQALADVARFVTEHGVTTVYTETLVDPAVAETVASETGAQTAVLDPLEGLTDESAGQDYLEVMRANVTPLRQGQGCS